MSDAATLSRMFSGIEDDMQAVDELFRERAQSRLTVLNEASFHILGSQGKRLRTSMTLLSGKIFGYSRDRLIPLSAGFEMLHLASLVHDDIIDRSSTRRGLKTVNAHFGNEVALLLGDFYFAKTSGLIADVYDNRIDRLFSDTVATIVEGTIQEMLDAHHLDLSLDHYLTRIHGKTACLIAACCKGGAMVCGATDEQCMQMSQFGEYLGLAFQIIDDVLDYQGTEKVIGKPAGNDLRQGMVTLPLIYALDHSSNGYLGDVTKVIQDPDAHTDLVPEIVQWVNQSGGTEQAITDARRYAQLARESLQQAPNSPERQIIEDVIDYVLRRDH